MTGIRMLLCQGLGANIARNGTLQKIQQWADQHKIPSCRLNYRHYGNGEQIWNVNDWRQDIVEALTEDESVRTVLVGISAGCQSCLRACLDVPNAVAGLLLFSPGVGLTLDFMERVLPGSVERLQKGEVLNYPAADPSLDIKVDLDNLMDFVNNCVTKKNKTISLPFPVRIFHGINDELVPFKNSLQLLSQINSPNKALYLINDGHFISDKTTIEQALNSLWDVIDV